MKRILTFVIIILCTSQVLAGELDFFIGNGANHGVRFYVTLKYKNGEIKNKKQISRYANEKDGIFYLEFDESDIKNDSYFEVYCEPHDITRKNNDPEEKSPQLSEPKFKTTEKIRVKISECSKWFMGSLNVDEYGKVSFEKTKY